MNDQERKLNQLSKYIYDSQKLNRLNESEDWGMLIESLVQDMEANLREMLQSDTTSQRYYELRAEVNSVKKLFDKIDVIQARGRAAKEQKAKLELT